MYEPPSLLLHQYHLLSLNKPKMPRKGSKRVGFSPNTNEKPMISLKLSFATKSTTRSRSHKQIPTRSFTSSPVRLLRYVRANVVRALRLVSKRRPSAEGPSNMIPQQFIPPRDSHQSENLEDCIEFINSSYRKSL